MIYPIVKYGAKVLEQEAGLVTEFDGRLEQLVADMFETMYAAQGVGPLRARVIRSSRTAFTRAMRCC